MSELSDRELGMARAITRRDFLNGMAVGVGGAMVGGVWRWDSQSPHSGPAGAYPPSAHGLRGSHDGSFEVAHALRDGQYWNQAGPPGDTGETYDLIVVGGGISGLAAAHFFRARAGRTARILILDNHDDFGGHAKRNEFHVGGRLLLMNGGTMLIDSPTPYSREADGLLKELGIEPTRLAETATNRQLYSSLGLGPAFFFDKETFGADKLVAGLGRRPWSEFLADAPLAPAVRRDIQRIEEGKVDYLPGLSSAEKKARLSRVSYRDFLLNIAKVDPGVVAFYQTRTHGEWGVGIDAESALDCWAEELPGFDGLALEPGAAPHMSYTAAGYANGGSYRFHFPDGNATIARLLVRSLVPEAVPGSSVDDVVTAEVSYEQLDRAEAPVRIRLNSTVVRARNVGDPRSAREVEVAYVRGGKLFTVHGRSCVLACWNMMIPYLCPELPERQKEAMHYLVKVPLVYTSVALRDWTSFQKLGAQSVTSPGCYHSSFSLNQVVNVGDYRSPVSPSEPTLVHMTRTPCSPGLSAREQHKIGRLDLLSTTFETFERKIRDQLARALAGGGFDPARDIDAITVNRWPHGYGYEYNPLFDPEWPEQDRPNVIGRQPFGRIAIANSDAAATAYTDAAIDQAYRAVTEVLSPSSSRV
jgi:spermidine dehydrogenase